MNWVAVPFADQERKKSLKMYLDVYMIPCLVVITPSGMIISKTGYEDVVDRGKYAYSVWQDLRLLKLNVKAGANLTEEQKEKLQMAFEGRAACVKER